MTDNSKNIQQSQSFFYLAIQQVNRVCHSLRIVGPVYLTSIALVFAYGWSWLITFPGVFGWALVGVTATAELLKPILGPAIEDRARERNHAKVAALFVSAACCIAFGTVSGVIAFNAAEAPAAAYREAQAQVARAEAAVTGAERALESFACTGDMPASRCATMRAANAEAEGRALDRERLARVGLQEARAALPENPAVTAPFVPLWVKIYITLGIDFILFVVPWAARATPSRPVLAVDNSVRVNDGGWSARRAKYGPTGRRQKPRLVSSR